MKKVLFVATVSGHIKNFHEPYLKLFKDKGYLVYVAAKNTLIEGTKIEYCDYFIDLDISRSPYSLNNIKAIKKLKRIIDKEQFDIIHCHTPMGSVVARLAAKNSRKKFGTRVIYTAHGFHFYKGAPIKNWLLFYPVEFYLLKYTDTLITINNEDYELAKRKFSQRCNDIQYLPGVGIDINKFNIKFTEKEKIIFKKSLGLNKDAFVLTCIARLDINKNQGFLIECMKALVERHDNIHLLLAGKDELNGYYQNMVKRFNLNNNVHFLGNRDDIPKILKITDIVVSASKREGLPVNIIESFAAGVPVVTLNCRGMKDLIENGENGYITTNLIKKIIVLYENYGLKEKMSNNNIIKSEKYSLNNILAVIKTIYFRKKTIVHVLASNKFSGAENVVCTIINNMKYNYNMYYCCPEGPIVEKLKEFNINFITIKKLSFFEINKVIKRIRPDIIHAHDNKATVLCSFYAKKVNIISHIHGNNKIMNTKNIKTILFNFCSKNLKKIIWVSDSSFNDYYFKSNVIKKSIVLYNVIDYNKVIEKSNVYKCNCNYDLIFLGRLGYPKNPERLIRIISQLVSKNKDIKVAIVGDGSERNNIENMIKNYNLNNNIKMYGFQSNPYPILKSSKILIMTSIYEGTPMCALEAQALGKPIVATPVDGLKKIVRNDYNGFLSDNDDVLVEKIIYYLKEEKYNELSNNVKKFFLKNNNLKKYFNNLSELYIELS